MKSIFTIISLLITTMLFSQYVITENFEVNPTDVSSSSTGTGIWTLNSRIQSQGLKSDSAVVTLGDTTYLTTKKFVTTNKFSVVLSFDQICKIEFFDSAYIEYSTDSINWTRVTGANYLGSGGFVNYGNRFFAGSYSDWILQDTFAVPQNSWWKHETFDLSNKISNIPQAWIRFVLVDGGLFGSNGSQGFPGWFIDSLSVSATFSEILPPTITLLSPVLEGTAYGSTPFSIGAHIFDLSGVDTAICAYHVMPDNIYDTLAMVLDASAADSFYCNIPFYGYGRSITYTVIATDASSTNNVGSIPAKTFYCKHSVGGTYVIGTGTTSNYYYGPIYRASSSSAFDYSRYSSLISASELAAAGVPSGGQIVKLEWYKANASKTNGNAKFDIYLKNSTQTTLISSLWTNAVSGATKVYSSTTQSIPVTSGWLPFSITPFTYSGQGIEISTDWDISAVSGYPTTGAFNWRYTKGVSGDKTIGNASNVKPTNLSTTYGGSRRPNVRITFMIPSNIINDIGVSSIENPSSSVPVNTDFYLDVKVKNFGIDTVSSFIVKYALNGILQDSIVYTGVSLFPDSVMNIRLDTLNVPSGGYTITSWTVLPNGNSDFNFGNDTSIYSFYSCASPLSGTYTVGGIGADFPTFLDVESALNQCGISGPTVFNVNSGTYNENIELLSVLGSSVTNTITFQSVSGDSSDVVLSHSSVSNGDNFVLSLNGTSNISFKKMSFVATGAYNTRVVVLKNKPNDISFSNCVFKATTVYSGTVSGDNRNLVSGLDSIGNNVEFKYSTFTNGNKGLLLTGGAAMQTGWNVSNNFFTKNAGGSVFLSNSNSCIVNENLFSNDSVRINFYHSISIQNSQGSIEVLKNKIDISGTATCHAVHIVACTGSASNYILCANNFVHVNQITASHWGVGIQTNNSKFVNVYYNNVHITGAHAASSAFQMDNTSPTSASNINLTNNIFATTVPGGSIYRFTQCPNTVYTNDYNDLYNGVAGKISGSITTLSAWQAASADGAHSIVVNPVFTSDADLHIANNLMNGLGTPIAGITTDIDGDIRNTTTPDIGADEFDPSPWDVAAIEILSPLGSCGLTSTEAVTLRIKNVGGATVLSGLTASYSWPGGTTVTESITDSIQSGDTLDYTFTATADLDISSNGADSTFAFSSWVSLSSDQAHYNDTAYLDVESKLQPPMPVTQNVDIAYGTSTVITATSTNSMSWWATDTSSIELAKTNNFTTPILNDTTTFWVSAISGGGGSPILITECNLESVSHVEIQNITNSSFNASGWKVIISNSYTVLNTANVVTWNLGTIAANTALWKSAAKGPNFWGKNILWSSGKKGWAMIVNSLGEIQDFAAWGWTATELLAMNVNAGGFTGLNPMTSTVPQWVGNGIASSCSNTLYRINYDLNNLSDWTCQKGTKGIANVMNNVGSSSCESQRAPLTVNVTGFPPVDAGIASIVNPSSTILAGSQQIIQLALANYGTDTLTTVDLVWMKNGQLPDTFHYSGSLLHKGRDTVNVDTTGFGSGLNNIVAWTSSPNGITDTVNSNDTAFMSFKGCLSGTYLIGSGANADFASFNDAITAVDEGGLCGHVIFNVASGVYYEQLIMQEIPGMDSSKTIIFQSLSGDSTDVVLQFAGISYSYNYTLLLDGIDYTTFRNMTIKSVGTTYGGVVQIQNQSTHITFENNVIETKTGITSYMRGIYSSVGTDDYLHIINNRFVNGVYVLFLSGTTVKPEKGLVIKGNIIEGFGTYGIRLAYEDSVEISDNTVIKDSITAHGYGIYLYHCNNVLKITNNKLIYAPTGYVYGLYLNGVVGATYNKALIANNMIAITSGTGISFGFYINGSANLDVFYNSVNMLGSNQGSRAVYFPSFGIANNISFRNNIFKDTAGYTVYNENVSNTISFDYNNYYSNSSKFAYFLTSDISDFASWKLNTGQDAHSLNIDAVFVSDSSLYLADSKLLGFGTPLAAVTSDIDGTIRGLAATTIGAHELPLLKVDIALTDVLNVPDSTIEGQTYGFDIVIKNFGTDTIFGGFNIKYSVNGGAPVSQAYTNTFNTGMIDTVSLATFVSPSQVVDFCAYVELASDTNKFNDTTCVNFFGVSQTDAKIVSIKNIEAYCSMQNDTITIYIANVGIDTINSPNQVGQTTVSFKSDNLSTATVTTENFNTLVVPGATVAYTFTGLADFTNTTQLDSLFTVTAWIDYPGDNVKVNDTAYYEVNSMHTPIDPVFVTPITTPYGTSVSITATATDTIMWYDTDTSASEFNQGSIYNSGLLYTTDTLWLEAVAGGGSFKLTETVQYKKGAGYTNPYPLYLPTGDFDGVEITNLGSGQGDLSGYEIYVQMGIIQLHYIFPQGSMVDVGETALALYASGLILGPAGNNVYNISSSSPISSSSMVAYWLKDASGVVVDAFAANGASFPVGSGVTPADFSGTLIGSSGKAGAVRTITDNNLASDWQFTSNATASFGSLNTMLPLGGIGGGSCASNRVSLIVNVLSQSAIDVGILSIDEPVSGPYKSADDSIKIRIVNLGSSNQSSIPVNYSINGSAAVSEVITSTIAANDTLEYTFSQTADLSTVGATYSIVTYTTLPSDATALNDTVKKSIIHEYPTYCISKANYGTVSEITNVTVGNMLNNSSAVLGAQYTNFMPTVAPGFIQMGTPTALSITTNFTPPNTFNSNGYIKVFIDYNHDNDFYDTGEEVFVGTSQASTTVIGTFTVPVNAMSGITSMRIVHQIYGTASTVFPCGSYKYGETEDYLIEIAPRIPNDAGVEMIISPASQVASPTVSAVVRIRNYGTDTITSVDIAYVLNGATPVITTYNTAFIYPMDSVDVSLGSINLMQGNNTFCAYTILADDTNTVNDQKCRSIFQEANVSLTYTDDFEGTDLWMADTIINQWERGVPAMTNINTAHSPVNVWGIDLDGTYANLSDDYLYSPYMVTTGLDSAQLKFWHYYNTEVNDGGAVEISMNKGSWITVGVQNDAHGTNWYNATIGGNPFWSGNSSGWVESTYMINFSLFLPAGVNSADTIQLRYHFHSNNAGNTKDGWAIDDVSVELPKVATDGGVIAITNPSGSTTTGSSVTVGITVKNFGSSPLMTIPVVYTVGTTVQTGTIVVPSPGLLPDSTVDYTFTNTFIGPSADYSICAETNITGDPYQQNDKWCEAIISDKAPVDVNVYGITVNPAWADTTKITYDDTLTMHIENKGTTAITAMVLEYSVGGALMEAVNWTGNLASGDTLHYTFSKTFKSPVNWYPVSAKATLANDADLTNNQFSHNYYGMNDIGFENNDGDIFSVNQNQPNPAHGKVVVNYNLPKSGKVQFELRNALGQVIMSQEYERSVGNNQIEIDATQLSSGIYYYTVEFDKQRITKKMVVNN